MAGSQTTSDLLLAAVRVGGLGWAHLQTEDPRPADLQVVLAKVLSCPRTDAAFRALLRCVRTPAERYAVHKTIAEAQRSSTQADVPAEEKSTQLLATRDRHIAELAAMRRELSTCQTGICTHQTAAEGQLRKREELTRSCDVARRQLVHLQGYRCKLKRHARVLRGSASQFQLHAVHSWPAAPGAQADADLHAAAHNTIRQHLAQLVQRTFTAEGALVDESIRFLRNSGTTLQQLTGTLSILLTEQAGQLQNQRSGMHDESSNGEERSERDPAATRKMRTLLTLAHRQHVAAYEEVEALHIQGHEARLRAEELAAGVEKQLSQVTMSDSEWRITSISMKQDRDLAAARASVRVVQGRLNDMKIKVQMGKETADRLHDQRFRLKALEGDIQEGRRRAALLVADIRRLFKLVYERNGDISRFCENDIVRSGPALEDASECARCSLTQHAVLRSLAPLPAAGHIRRHTKDASIHTSWHVVAQAATRALCEPAACTDHLLLQRVATAIQIESVVAAHMTFTMARKEAFLARASKSSWHSAITMANTRASLNTWDTVSIPTVSLFPHPSLPCHTVGRCSCICQKVPFLHPAILSLRTNRAICVPKCMA